MQSQSDRVDVKAPLSGRVAQAWHRIKRFYDRHYLLYLLIALPFMTGLIEEEGSWPTSLRGWTTELCIGVVIAVLTHKIRVDNLRLRQLARTDGLTGLLNRRSFDEAIESECARSRRAGGPLTILLFDLDKFKIINDRFGHHAGDQVLKCVARSITATARAGIDHGFRLGGDEFAVLLPGSTEMQARSVLTRLLNDLVGRNDACIAGCPSMSIGIVTYAAPETAAEFVQRADAAMYSQKLAQRSH
jgi:diguanylate cyclase (GGDEF)-like protein